jgi:hypothetical protein
MAEVADEWKASGAITVTLGKFRQYLTDRLPIVSQARCLTHRGSTHLRKAHAFADVKE